MTKDEALKLARTALGVQLDALLGKAGHLRNDDRRRYAENGIKAIDEALAQPEQEPVIDGNTSDGYHTFNELYEFRKAYNIALFNEWAANGKCFVHKSWRHNDGELCFGGGWFIVVAVLPQGQISNHYEAKDWDLFHIQETEKALFEFDGHTGADVIERLKSYTTPPQRKPLTDKELNLIGAQWHYNLLGKDDKAELFAFARAIEAAHNIKGEA